MLGPRDLVLCAGTIPRASFHARVAAAAEAGFSAVSLFAGDYFAARGEGVADSELRRILTDYGIVVAELDPLIRWIPGAGLGSQADAQGAAFFQYGEEDFYRIADALGARSLNLVVVSDRSIPEAQLAETFANLCDRAAGHGLLVHLEFLPWTQIPDILAALRLVEQADRPNGGIMLDTWHHFRSGVGDEALRSVPGKRILALQLNDAPLQPEADPVEETMHRRLLPGAGAIDLAGLLRRLEQIGAPAPVGVEVFSDELGALTPVEAARRAGAATRGVLQAARG